MFDFTLFQIITLVLLLGVMSRLDQISKHLTQKHS